MKKLLPIIFLFTFHFAQAQGYWLHLTVDKVQLGSDSVLYKKGKTQLLSITGRSDTIEVATIKSTPVAVVFTVSKRHTYDRDRYTINYSFFKKELGKWVLIKSFTGSDRYDLNKPEAGFEKSALKKSAREEYTCSYGYPATFSAKFRLDVYRN
jgi:hypothetical protein